MTNKLKISNAAAAAAQFLTNPISSYKFRKDIQGETLERVLNDAIREGRGFKGIVLSVTQQTDKVTDSDGGLIQHLSSNVRIIGIHDKILPDPLDCRCNADLDIDQLIAVHPVMQSKERISGQGIRIGSIVDVEFIEGRPVWSETEAIDNRYIGLLSQQPQQATGAQESFKKGNISLAGEQTEYDNVIKEFADSLEAVNIDGQNLEGVTKKAEEEINHWKGKVETNPDVKPRLQAYWQNLGWKEGTGGARNAEWTPTGVPWSAAFVSFLLKNNLFFGGASHYKYTENIVMGKNTAWKAFSLSKTEKVKINIGDILIKPRGKPGKKRGTDEERRRYYSSHGDLVYKIVNKQARLVGGNVSNTAADVGSIQLDSDGFLKNSGKYLIILKYAL